ncbi:serine hydrolase [Tissierella carlieri]|uniref:serine hydrolase n=1 Tax=Tissierella carlieri TaxID=689904 RepID=UPI001C120B83|nr:serine hydrolase [Tissierella carlieri]MBU5311313.1 serine hydrolase [Tissierella carlieri]
MSRRLISLILSFILILGIPFNALSEAGSKIQIILDEEVVELENNAFLNQDGKLMYPLRDLAEKLGYSITWNGNQNITFSNENSNIQVNIGKSIIVLDQKEIDLETNIIAVNGKTFVPLSFLSDALDLVVGWDTKTQSLRINQIKKNNEDYFQSYVGVNNELNNYMELLHKYENFNGSILIAKKGDVILDKGYGFADIDQNIKNKTQTRFAIGSVTKQFTAMAIMQLDEKQMLNIEDKISKYLPDFPNGDGITIHNLLTHTSGLVNYTELPEFYALESEDPKVEDVLNLIKDKPLEFESGTQFKYCNTGYALLSEIIEKVSGVTFEEYLHENIFKPLNMKDTGVCYGKNKEIHHATAYSGHLDLIPVDDEILLSQAYGAGNMYSTVEDLYRWDRALNTEQLVKKESLDKMFKGYIDMQGMGDYGYGWLIRDTEHGKEIFHTGGTLGFTANIAKFIDEDLTIIVLTNRSGYDVINLTDTLASITLGKEYTTPEPIKEIQIKDKALYDNYVGEYVIFPGFTITITAEEGKIYAMVTGQDKYEIFPESEESYFYKIVKAKITFVKGEDGKVTSLILDQNGQNLTGIKMK